ncbi:MAG: hypothetical protein ACYCW6_01160 [Candidatus Xenobia bacterium]
MRKPIALLLLMLGVAWAKPYVSRADLVVPWAPALDAAEPPRPFVCHFPHLYYIATHHATRADSPTFKLIRQVFQTGVFASVIVEGMPASAGENPPRYVKYAEEDQGEEAGLAARLALRHHIPFMGGEPPEEAVVHAVLSHGYTAEDLLGFYWVRLLPELQRDGHMRGKSVRQAFGEYMPDLMAQAGLHQHFSYNRFLRWYHAHNLKRFDAHADLTEETAPLADSALFTRRLSSVVGLVRDRAVIDNVARALNRHGSVLVVYGGSHFGPQRPALQAMLGPPLETYGLQH